MSNQWVVLETDIKLVSGAFDGNIVVGFQALNSSGGYAGDGVVYPINTPDTAEAVVGAGVVGNIYRWRVLIQLAAGATSGYVIIQTGASSKIIVYRANVRTASSSEILAKKADAALNTPVTGVLARITTEETTRVAADAALATRASSLESSINTPTTGVIARLTTEESTRASADTALGNRATALESSLNTPNTGVIARLTTEETTRANAVIALASRTTAVESTLNTATTGVVARLTSEESTRASADTALANRATAIESSLNTPNTGVVARLTSEESARASADSSLATRATALETSINTPATGLLARLTAEETARATADTAIAARTTITEASVGASINTNSRFTAAYSAGAPYTWSIWSQAGGSTVGVSDQTGRGATKPIKFHRQGSSDVGIQQSLNNLPAGWYVIDAEVQLTAGNWQGSGIYASFANDNYNLSFATYPDTNGLITNGATNTRRAFSFLVNSRDQGTITLYAMGGWSAFGFDGSNSDTHWHQCSIRPASDGEIKAQKIADANLIARVTTSETALVDAQAKFAAAAWTVEAVTPGGRAAISVRSSTSAGAGVDIIGDVNFAGRVIHNNGVIMKVGGLGFGTSNQFLEWVGPSKANLNECSESEALQYLKTNGSAYFGGSLSAGTLRNAVQTSILAANAAVTTGNFGSVGHNRQVVVTYQFSVAAQTTSQCPANPVSPKATLELYRGTDATGQLLTSQTFAGLYECSNGTVAEPGNMSEDIGGSFTFTDTSGGTSASYYARLVNRQSESSPTYQGLSLISVEE